jgi:hypothetical protein
MHPSRILILLGAAVAAGSLALDALQTATATSWSMVAADAWPGVALIGVIAIFAVAGHVTEGFTPAGSVVAVTLASTAALLLVGKYIDVLKAIDTLQLGGHTVSMGAGMWVLAAGVLITIVGTLWTTSRRLR